MPFKILVAAYSDALRILTFDPVASPPSLTLTSSSPSGKNPSWVAVHPTRPEFIIAVNEIQPEGKIQLFKLIQHGHALELLQTVESGGADPAHVIVTDNEVLVANVSAFTIPIRHDPMQSTIIVLGIDLPRNPNGSRPPIASPRTPSRHAQV
jgi:6-phosphogluconolactonase (cycloisomerase 2 family)